MILGVDYGSKRIGLALGSADLKISLPFKMLDNKNFEFLLLEFRKIINEEKVKKIVVGLPVSLAGKITDRTKETQKFIVLLAKNLMIPIIAIDERLTSKLADKIGGGFKKKGARDIGAAMIILENFFSREK